MADPFDYGVNYLQQRLGLEPHQARGAVRWMRDIESGLSPTITNPTSGAYGIAQWLDRKPRLFAAYGPKPSLEQQYAFIGDELQSTEARALQAMRGTKTEDEAFRTWGKAFERPSAAEYAKATGGYSSGLRSGGRPEGYYDNALNVTLRPEKPETPFPFDAALEGLLGGKPIGEAEGGEDHPLSMLDNLLGPGPKEGGEARLTQPESQFIEPLAPEPQRSALVPPADLPSAEVRPLPEGAPQAGPAMIPPVASDPNQLLTQLLGGTPKSPATQDAPQPSAPPHSPQTMLDALLQGALTYGEFVRGSNKGLALPGEELTAALPEMSGPQLLGAAVGRVPGGIVDAARGAGETLRQTMVEGPQSAEALDQSRRGPDFLGAAMFGMKPAAGGRLPGGARAEPPVPAGYQRLYRVGEAPGEIPRPPARDNPQPADVQANLAGRWFTDNKGSLDYYLRDKQRGSHVYSIDIPASEAELYRLSKNPNVDAARYSGAPDREFVLPPSVMDMYGVKSAYPPTTMERLWASDQGAIRIPPQLVQGVKDAGKGIEKVFSPSSVDAFSEAGEALIRKEVGTGRRRSEQAEAQVGARGPGTRNPNVRWYEAAVAEPWRPLVQRYVPELEAYIRSKQQGYAGPPVADPALLRFIDFVETRSQGARYQGPPELRPLADIMRDIYKDRQAQIAAEPSTAGTTFIEDYYAHQYRDHAAVTRSFVNTAKQGSGRSLRERSIPTLREAIDRGFEPVTLDPVDMTMRYVTNIDSYLAHNRIFRVGRDSGMIRFYSPGKQPDGWDPLTGRLAERAVATGGVPGALGLTAYAPEGFARIYNNTVSQGFLSSPLGAKAYAAALHTKNAINQAVLSLSGYHALAMAQEASASAFASGIAGLKAGDIRWGLKQLGLGAIPFVKAGKDVFGVGRKFERQYRGIADYGPEFEQTAKLYAEAGGRAVGRGAEYQGTAANNYFTSFRRGQSVMEWKAGLRHVGEGNPLYAPARAMGLVAHELARINETITAPLFDKAIPRLKGAAFYDEMSQWLRKNPMATHEEQMARARQVQETVDDRFGELVMDNLFWGKRTKQTLQLAATSLGWEHGSIRSIGGSAFDAVRGEFSPRVRYVIGLGAAIGIMNASYQYLKTGKTPGEGTGGLLSAGGALDLMMPQTGGKTPEGATERALLPGFEKDIIGYAHDPIGEFVGKLSPAGRLLGEFWSGRDYFGREISPFPKYTPEWFKAYGGHVLGAATPIPFKQEQLKGTAMGQAERFLGNRPAPERWQNPMRQEKMESDSRIRDLKGRLVGMTARGVRTKQEVKEQNEKTREILGQIQQEQLDFQKKLQGSKSSRYLYKPLRSPAAGP